MTRFRTHLAGISAVASVCALLATHPTSAASLVPVNGWNGGISFPSDVKMNIYVPDHVATNPPILTLVHYCGGSASSVFGQAKTVINAADQTGVIVIVPDNGARCWDVQTTKGLTRDGGGDSHAIAQMVRYTITQYKANPDRVYSTGDSSGGMMTQLLLALYPDIFKAGASFAGIPAGCRVGNETGNGYSGSCAGGTITKTAQQWGDIVRNMDPGYSGHRPRVQLFHGDKDEYINYAVHAEAIKEWANVLGLDPTAPTSTSTVTLGTHQATRKTWKNDCGFVVLDAFLAAGADHGPSDCLFNSYVPPFLGLDKTGDVDPEIAQCGAGGTSSSGGASSTGGTSTAGLGSSGGAGGRGVGGSGGKTGVTTGGSSGAPTGGATATGGAPSNGGTQSAGGRSVVGGAAPSSGGTNAKGGSLGVGGNLAAGGNTSSSGDLGSGGIVGFGGAATGGARATSSVAPQATGGSSRTGSSSQADTAIASPSNADSGGCSCTFVGTKRPLAHLFALALGAMVVRKRRRKH